MKGNCQLMAKEWHWVLVKCKVGISLPSKSMVRVIDCSDMIMTIDVKQQHNNHYNHCLLILWFRDEALCKLFFYKKKTVGPPSAKGNIEKKILIFIVSLSSPQWSREGEWNSRSSILTYVHMYGINGPFLFRQLPLDSYRQYFEFREMHSTCS